MRCIDHLIFISPTPKYIAISGYNACVWRHGETRGGDGGWRERSEGVEVQREAKDEVVFEENQVRGSEIECGEEAPDEREVREESQFCGAGFGFAQ